MSKFNPKIIIPYDSTTDGYEYFGEVDGTTGGGQEDD